MALIFLTKFAWACTSEFTFSSRVAILNSAMSSWFSCKLSCLVCRTLWEACAFSWFCNKPSDCACESSWVRAPFTWFACELSCLACRSIRLRLPLIWAVFEVSWDACWPSWVITPFISNVCWSISSRTGCGIEPKSPFRPLSPYKRAE